MRLFLNILILVNFIWLAGCSSQGSQTATSVQNTFTTSSEDFDVDIKTFHLSDSQTRIYLKFSTDKLLYARRNSQEATATLLVEFKSKEKKSDERINPETKKVRISDTDPEKLSKTLIAHTDIELQAGYDYVFEMICTDINRGVSSSRTISIRKSSPNLRENFIVFQDSLAFPVFDDRVKANTTYTVQFNEALKSDSITVLYYNKVFQLPPPPFVLYEPEPFDYIPESKLKYPKTKDNRISITTNDEGFYHVLMDPTQRDGHTLFVSEPEFPKIEKVEDMAEAFRFLVGGKEYKSVVEAVNPKRQIESFWIDWAGNKDRARKCIKAFYGGVRESNIHFSSHVEGWKSDRGLIYIIYGKPNKVYRTEVSESWIYGEENNPLSITFDFIKVNNPFTDNDYRLNRDEMYKPSWYRSVNAWRDGRIY
jgi:GWxTD domain-containing protein